ncbi:MAG: DNA polymerase/3'-5' exonuclease PolX [Candidatus Pacebacteria bacterium]|nr:DNA polymerase/3'-5' exonuclease PolX [Candidatus Paceibacterota bacterium]MDD2796361.1 DNA polymerase/3'-5' exonuclease PolX [Candidatus Paceibacterota bacterium]MDD3048015.1 DNA polymerase/3'-5' exonuclease PolX [Candidatus Paceibacterota bacterium]MDD3509858.1 DNA polymerase/3'-5' exonuclease PolX [Candidatus Paceibacterota bacterium]MDD3918378.1 DNA polymerase/3'-5' exonuclease PolX [Candidatus Paceibacterota bacterium]
MKNEKIAKILFEIGEYLELDNIPFKPRAYQMAALSIDNLEEDIQGIYNEKGIKGVLEIQGVGKGIALKIEEYLKTGKIKYLEELKRRKTIDVKNLLKVEGLGPKRINFLNKELGITNILELKQAIKENKLKELKGFGEKSQQNILESIAFVETSGLRYMLSEVQKDVSMILEKFKRLKEVEKIEVAGSYRRKKETIGDVDILIASSKPKKIMDEFTSFEGVSRVWGKGKTKTSLRMEKGFNIDLRVVPLGSFGSALQYFTGSKEHNVALRRLAISKGYKLNEYGLFKEGVLKAGKDEVGIYKKLGLQFIPPELRENRGEIEAGLKRKIPKLIELKDIRGDFHTHSNFAGTLISMEEIVLKAIQKGYEYIGISDHTKALKIENGLDEKELALQAKEIEKLNKKYREIRIFHGAEVNILKDGSLDIKNSALKELDFVNIGVHANFKMKKEEMTERVLKAMSNPYVTCLVHPTGRIVNKREAYDIDLEKIFEFANLRKILLEVSSSHRLDLNDYNIKRAKEKGCKFLINTDTHMLKHMDRMKYGIYQARRGWLTKKDVINTLPLNKIYGKISRSNNL